MTKRHLCIIMLSGILGACASMQSREAAQQNRQSIDDALAEAAAVVIPEAESPSD